MRRSPPLRTLLIALLVLAAFLVGCREDNERSPYRPGGPYAERLDAPGRRMTIDHPDGTPALKVRASVDRYKVYDDALRRVGEVRWDDDAGRVEIRENAGEPWQAVITDEAGVVTELDGRFSLERVADGWALFDPKATLLGYIDRDEEKVAEGEEGGDEVLWTVRDDFSSAPRLLARGGALETPKGKARFRTHADELGGPFLVVMAFDELDALSRVALGAWLRHVAPDLQAAPAPPAEPLPFVGPPAPDAGADTDAGADAG